MANIKIMDEILANKIAAGEVVERCASVVKELVENSIDAKASEVKIELIEAGTKMIRVTDDGCGMDKEDAITCFGRHATSKLKNEEDLYRIQTLGFRGEALSSIASVSEVTLKTSDGRVGTLVQINGGKIVSVDAADARKGTTLTIANLFYNTPARLKHLKSLYTELASITDYINKIALSHPDIKFILINNGSLLLNTDGSNNLLKTIKAIYGIDVVKKMIAIEVEDNDYTIKGYMTIPEIHRSSRNHMITLVNGRVVKNVDLARTINDSYHSYKPDNRYPIVVLDIIVDPSLVDVNIHPTKMDIKFSKLEELLSLVGYMIKEELKKLTLIPEVEFEKELVPIASSYQKPSYSKETVRESPRYQEQTLSFVKEEESTYKKEEEYVLVDDFVEESQPLFVKKQPKERFPELYPIGLVHGTYIICQNDLGMYLIDQHAAKERCNYEFFKKKLGSPTNDSASLLFPMTIELSNNEFIILKQHFEILEKMGFTIEEFGVNSIIIKSHPVWLTKGKELDSTRHIIEAIIECEKNFSVEKFNEKVATLMSCKQAIKANENITIGEMEHLIDDLSKCDNPFNCPHGRPTIIFYSNYDLEKLFKRSGF